MRKTIEKLLEETDQAATDYVKSRSEVSEKLTDQDAEIFGWIIGAKKNLAWAVKEMEKQDAETD